jgi:hypothetical protein
LRRSRTAAIEADRSQEFAIRAAFMLAGLPGGMELRVKSRNACGFWRKASAAALRARTPQIVPPTRQFLGIHPQRHLPDIRRHDDCVVAASQQISLSYATFLIRPA